MTKKRSQTAFELTVDKMVNVALVSGAPPQIRGIAFSGPMARAVARGEKTQTRRILKMEPWIAKLGGDLSKKAWPDKAFGVTPCLKIQCADGTVQRNRNPWGWPNEGGTLLYVREAWRADRKYDHLPPSKIKGGGIWYEADDDFARSRKLPGRYRHARFMPRRFSRTWLRIIDVRAERVQAISDADIAAEGVTADAVRALWEGATRKQRLELVTDAYTVLMVPEGTIQIVAPSDGRTPALRPATPRDYWRIGWTLINGAESWSDDGWVWVVEFERAARPEDT